MTEPARPAVLVVDDVEGNLVAVEALLADMNCDVVLTRSGNQALRALLKREFAVALVDVQMPEMDGFEVARHARQNPATRDVPLVFLTATHDSEEGVLRGYGSGAVDFLFKPIDSVILRSKVRVFLDLYRTRSEIAAQKRALEKSHSELEVLYRDLQSTQAQLVQSAKMASLGELVAGIAHEINNPLSFAISHLDTAQRSIAHVEAEHGSSWSETSAQHFSRARSRLHEMGIGLERIRELVVKLRTFSRLDEGERKRVNLRECIDSVLMILRHRMKDRIVVELSLGVPEELECYPGLLNQALLNLLANAIEAIVGEGKIRITTGVVDGAFSIRVTDTGPGIPDALRQRVFEPFFTTKPIGQGTGLGLSITYSIVEKHGGSIDVECFDGGGTTMTMRLPLGAAEATAP
ncbi:MAG TPA: ATP-binding protein [Polyangiaceae bacterium]